LNPPTCSVVIAAYNAAPTIGQAIASVLLQTRRDLELIVIDDGSSDDTAARVAPFLADRRVVFDRQPNAGPAGARNAGIELASGRYVSMLDSDDLWLPRYLERMVGALEQSPLAGFAFTRAWVLERSTGRFRKRPWHPRASAQPDSASLLRSLLEGNYIFNSVTARREILGKLGSYDPELLAKEDYELWLRIAAHGYAAAYVPGPLCIYSDRPGSLSRDERRQLLGLEGTLAKALRSYGLSPALASIARARQARVQLRLAQLDSPAREPVSRARRAVADRARHWRQRCAFRREPPPEVKASFARLGGGERSVARTLPAASSRPPETPPRRGLATVVVRGVSIAGVGYAVTQAISLASYLVLARLLVPNDFGTFAAATLLVSLGFVVGESGLQAALIQRRERVEEAFDSAFVASLALGLALTLAGIAAAPLVGLFFHSFRTGIVAAVMAGSMALRLAVITPNARLQRSFSFVRRVLIDPIGTLAFTGGAVAGAVAGMGPWALVIGTYAQLLVDVAAAWGLVRWRPQTRRASVSMWRELARFGRPVFGSHLVSRARDQTPVVAVGRVLGTGALGQFSLAVKIAAQPILAVVDVGAYVLLPALARIAPDDARFRAGVLRALRWTCAIAFPLGLLLVPLGTPAVVLVFGAKWRAAGHAVMALGVFCAALGLDSIATETWKAAATPSMLPRMQGLALGLTIVCVGALAPFGLVAVTVGMALAGIGQGVYAIRGIGRVAGIPSRRLLTEVWPPAIAATVMAAVLLVSEHLLLHADRHSIPVGIGVLVLEALLGLAIYLACLSALSTNVRTELLGMLRRGGRNVLQRKNQLNSIGVLTHTAGLPRGADLL
jgi:PST family polysaccharide transporter